LGGRSSAEIYGILKSPVRREIISLLYTRGELSATQLKLMLNVSYGTLYYHLDFLRDNLTSIHAWRAFRNPAKAHAECELWNPLLSPRLFETSHSSS